MKTIRRTFQVIFSITLISLSAFLVAELWVRSNLQYNGAGRYFDEESAVVYHEQALPVYWAFLLTVLLFLALTMRWILKR